MKKAMGLIELLIILIVIIIIYFTFFHISDGRKNPFEEHKDIKTKQELLETKIKDIESNKAIKQRIEQNLKRESY